MIVPFEKERLKHRVRVFESRDVVGSGDVVVITTALLALVPTLPVEGEGGLESNASGDILEHDDSLG